VKADRWQQLKTHLAELIPLDAPARAAYLDRLDDAPLRAELEDLLAVPSIAELRLTETSSTGAPGWQDSEGADISIAPDTRVGPYRILSIIGVGGMGEVFKAHDERLGRDVALKRLPRPWSADARRIWRFEREAKAASALNHPNIVTVHDILVTAEGRFIVTELIEGETLHEWIRRGPRDLASTLDITGQVVRALEVAHAAGIVHRDIKPANIMVRRDGVVKLLDFGVAKLTETDEDGVGRATAVAPTLPGVAIGTLRYMSPEQARGLHVDQRSDLFSLGVVLYEMLAGSSPFPGATPSDMLVGMLQGEPVPLRQHLPTLPPLLERVVDRALRKSVDDRYQSAQDLRADLQEVQRQLAQAVTNANPPTRADATHPPPVASSPPPGRRARVRPWMIALAVALLGLAAFAAYWSGRPRVEPDANQEAAASAAVVPPRRDRQFVRPAGLAGLRWIAIPGTNAPGTPWRVDFEMGCVPQDMRCDKDERPRHPVTLTRPYELTETEITVAQYAEFTQRTGHPAPAQPSFTQDPGHPVVGVTWADAAAFCGWLDGRLPTEAEWEHAARGGRPDQTYTWGTFPPSSGANLAGDEDGFAYTAPVGTYASNRYRLYDMTGNVWEWVSDWYAEGYDGHAAENPAGPATGDRRVLRGSGWTIRRTSGRLSDRGRNSPDVQLGVYGIRCARDVKAQ
jgi:serine/threonine protein kinase